MHANSQVALLKLRNPEHLDAQVLCPNSSKAWTVQLDARHLLFCLAHVQLHCRHAISACAAATKTGVSSQNGKFYCSVVGVVEHAMHICTKQT
jgi:hypothetical protein